MMCLSKWIREKIHGRRQDEKFDEALHVVDEIGTMSRELNSRLEPYRQADDPFIAMWTDAHNKNQMTKLVRDPNK